MLTCSFVGSPRKVEAKLKDFINRTNADELMVASAVFDHHARLRSYEFLADITAALSRTIPSQQPPA
jgi:alkanesulfonate monooxygenase SsuD/methylene tetrahydromethanopterin reductase-like flavin-dependent oxidoreductase (luciferase family)